MTSLEPLLAEIAFGQLPESDAPAEVDAWLAKRELAPADAERFKQELGRWRIYRGLVRERLRETVELALPRTVARLGSLFDEYFARFLEQRGTRTHYLRDVTEEFLEFAEPLFPGDPRIPGYALELARHEALRVVVGSSLDEPVDPNAAAELELERGLAFAKSARIVRYEHAVHHLPDDETDQSEPAREATALFVFRSPEHEVRYLEVSPLAARILERLLDGTSLRAALESACRDGGVTLDSAVLDGTAQVLADLAERKALLGPRTARDLPLAKSQPKMPDPSRPKDR